jgi:hypothetical protein
MSIRGILILYKIEGIAAVPEPGRTLASDAV